MTQSSMSNLLRSRGRQLSSRCMQSTACAGCCREAVKRCGLTHPGAAKAASESCRSEVPWPVCDGMVAVAWARAVRTGWCGWERRDIALRLNGAVAAGRVRSCTGDEGGTPWLQYHGPCTLHVRTRLVQFRTSDSRAGAHGVALGGRAVRVRGEPARRRGGETQASV